MNHPQQKMRGWSSLIFLSCLALLTPVHGQDTSYAKDLRPALAAKLKDYKPDSRFGGYALEALAKFEKGVAPTSGALKRHVGIAISLDDAHCAANDLPCEPLIYPALLVQEDSRIALTALRQRGNRRPPGEADPDSYVELFLSGSLKLGGTPEFKMLALGQVPRSLFGDVKLQPDEWIVRDTASVSALRQSGSWFLAVSADRSSRQDRMLIYAFPSTLGKDGKDDDEKLFAPFKK
jgi:hypothetical protein